MPAIRITSDATEQSASEAILVAGDSVLSTGYQRSDFSSAVTNIIRGSNLSIVNFEAPMRSSTPAQKNGPLLSQTADDIHTLSELGFDLCTLANNHTMDYGYEGLQSTINACNSAGMSYVGAGSCSDSAISPFVCSFKNTQVAVFNLCAHEFGIATENKPGVGWIREPGVHSLISETVDSVDLVLVVVHGGLEYTPFPSRQWQKQLRSLVDAGADAVVCHHPHVPQGWEIYNDAPIVYSVGNFAFKQNRPETRRGYLFELTIKNSAFSTGIVHPILNQDRIQFADPLENESYIQYLNGVSEIMDNYWENKGYWQEEAIYLFENKYQKELRNYGNNQLLSLLQHPVRAIDLLSDGKLSSTVFAQEQDLQALNYLQTLPHRDVIETALRIRTGVESDYRTKHTRDAFQSCLQWTNSRSNESVSDTTWRRIRTVWQRFVN